MKSFSLASYHKGNAAAHCYTLDGKRISKARAQRLNNTVERMDCFLTQRTGPNIWKHSKQIYIFE